MNKYIVNFFIFLLASLKLSAQHSIYAGLCYNKSSTNLGVMRLENDSLISLGWKNLPVNYIVAEQNTIYVSAGTSTLKSLDGGLTWREFTDWHITSVNAIYPVSNSNTTFLATENGVWKTEDDLTWQSKNTGLKPTSQTFIKCLLFPTAHMDTLIAGTADGLLISTNSGNEWRALALQGKEINCIVQSPFNKNIILVAAENSGIFISYDKGLTWKKNVKALENKTIYCIAFDKKNKELFYCGGYKTGLYSITNSGDQVTAIGNQTNTIILSLFVHQEKDELIFGTFKEGLWKYDWKTQNPKCILKDCTVKSITSN